MSEPAGQPGRYERTFGGLIGSMIVIVIVVLAFVIYRGVFRDPETIGRPEAIPASEYLGLVRDVQDAGLDPVWPEQLPDGWDVTMFDIERGDRPVYRFNFYTPDDKFVGLRQTDADARTLVEEHVDENAEEGDPLTGVGSISEEWTSWSDEGGDHGYATELPAGDTVLVYGNVPESALQELIEGLSLDEAPARTAEPVPAPS